MDNDLFPYQHEGARWLLDPLAPNKFRLLADEMRMSIFRAIKDAVEVVLK